MRMWQPRSPESSAPARRSLTVPVGPRFSNRGGHQDSDAPTLLTRTRDHKAQGHGWGNRSLQQQSSKPDGIITVKEQDLRRFGDDLERLRRCQVQPYVEQERPQEELSFKAAFEQRCRLPVEELRDPWRGIPNPEKSRQLSELDHILNEVCPQSPKKLECDPDIARLQREQKAAAAAKGQEPNTGTRPMNVQELGLVVRRPSLRRGATMPAGGASGSSSIDQVRRLSLGLGTESRMPSRENPRMIRRALTQGSESLQIQDHTLPPLPRNRSLLLGGGGGNALPDDP